MDRGEGFLARWASPTIISVAMFHYPVVHVRFVCLPKEQDSEWLHRVVLGWRKWFADQSRAKLQAEKMASQAKGLLLRRH